MTSDVWGHFWPTYPNKVFYYTSLCSLIRCSLTYLLTYLKIWHHMWMLPYSSLFLWVKSNIFNIDSLPFGTIFTYYQNTWGHTCKFEQLFWTLSNSFFHYLLFNFNFQVLFCYQVILVWTRSRIWTSDSRFWLGTPRNNFLFFVLFSGAFLLPSHTGVASESNLDFWLGTPRNNLLTVFLFYFFQVLFCYQVILVWTRSRIWTSASWFWLGTPRNKRIKKYWKRTQSFAPWSLCTTFA